MAFTNYSDVQAALDAEYLAWKNNVAPTAGSDPYRTVEGQAARDWWASQQSSGGGGGGGGGGAVTAAVAPAPVLPVFKEETNSAFKAVKVASKDIIVFDDSNVNIELLQDLLFEDIGAIELANISRYDLIDGQEVYYSPIKNLSTIKKEFNPNNIIASVTNNKTSYAIDLTSRTGTGTYNGITKGVPVLGEDGIYFYLDGLKEGEIVETQLVSGGTIDEIGEK